MGVHMWATNQLGDRRLEENLTGQQPTGRHILVNCMGDNIGRVLQDAYVGMSISSPCVFMASSRCINTAPIPYVFKKHPSRIRMVQLFLLLSPS